MKIHTMIILPRESGGRSTTINEKEEEEEREDEKTKKTKVFTECHEGLIAEGCCWEEEECGEEPPSYWGNQEG